jgi:pimeloyl-ACP methyl ester carboxylesterase
MASQFKLARRGWLLMPAVLVAVGCGSAGPPTSSSAPANTPTAIVSPAGEPSVVGTPQPTSVPPITSGTPVIDDAFAVAKDGRKMLIKCWGEGSHTVVLDGGNGTIQQWRGGELANRIAGETRLCLFDHPSNGGSDPAPNEPRSADDLTDDINALLKAAGVDHGLVMVGSSFGGMTMGYFAQRFPNIVEGCVVLDTPAPSAELNKENFPEGLWDAPGNTEHLEVLLGFENRFAKTPIKISEPLIVIRASGGQTSADDHYWLDNNPQAVEVNLHGGHDIYLNQPQAVAEQILSLVQ